MNFSSDIKRCVVPSRQAIFTFSTTYEGGAALDPLAGQSWAGEIGQQLSQRLALLASAAHGSV